MRCCNNCDNRAYQKVLKIKMQMLITNAKRIRRTLIIYGLIIIKMRAKRYMCFLALIKYQVTFSCHLCSTYICLIRFIINAFLIFFNVLRMLPFVKSVIYHIRVEFYCFFNRFGMSAKVY